MSSMFDGLYIARSGVRSSRAALNVTGQNITNANTPGYTRQRVDLNSIPPSGYGGKWAVVGASSGDGSSADAIEQLRDKFLDYEFRTQNAKSGDSSTVLNTLSDMEDIFTTTTTAASSSKSSVVDVLSDEFQNFLTEMEGLTSSSCNVSESDVRDEAGFLTEKLNTAAKALETARDHQYTALKDDNVGTVNTLLQNIASLSKQIKDSQISGEPVLELQDQRNLMLDNLSKYVPISVQETPETLPTGKTVDTMSVWLADSDGNKLGGSYELIGGTNGSDFAKFTVTSDGNGEDGHPSGKPFDITHIRLSSLSTDGGKTFGADTTMKNSDIEGGNFSGFLKLLNESGEYDTPAGGTTSTFRGIGFYSQYLDTLAKNLATTLNTLNNKLGTETDNDALLTGTNAGADSVGAVTAKNIHVAGVWTDGHLLMTKDSPVAGDKNGKSFSNINTMITTLQDTKIAFKTDAGAIPVYTGTFGSAFLNTSGMLAQGASSLQRTDSTNSTQLNKIDGKRQSVSSVSIDDEAVSIVQYSQSLNASSRFMTAVDECLQTIINNMGLAGRG